MTLVVRYGDGGPEAKAETSVQGISGGNAGSAPP